MTVKQILWFFEHLLCRCGHYKVYSFHRQGCRFRVRRYVYIHDAYFMEKLMTVIHIIRAVLHFTCTCIFLCKYHHTHESIPPLDCYSNYILGTSYTTHYFIRVSSVIYHSEIYYCIFCKIFHTSKIYSYISCGAMESYVATAYLGQFIRMLFNL